MSEAGPEAPAGGGLWSLGTGRLVEQAGVGTGVSTTTREKGTRPEGDQAGQAADCKLELVDEGTCWSDTLGRGW